MSTTSHTKSTAKRLSLQPTTNSLCSITSTKLRPLMHIIISWLQYVIQKITSPYYLNFSYIIYPRYCERTLRSTEPTKNFYLFVHLNGRRQRSISVPIHYFQYVEGRGYEMYVGPYLQTLQRLDSRQVSRQRTVPGQEGQFSQSFCDTAALRSWFLRNCNVVRNSIEECCTVQNVQRAENNSKKFSDDS